MTAPVPDTKDWTWVLHRACPECGFDTRAPGRSELAGLVASLPSSWSAVLGAGPDVRRRPAADRWSALEYGCHVRDVLRLGDHRIRLMTDQDDPTFPDWDQDRTAREDDYGRQDPHQVSAELGDAAVALARRLAGVPAAAWTRTGWRSNGSRFTVESFTRYLVHDPVHHLHDVGADRA